MINQKIIILCLVLLSFKAMAQNNNTVLFDNDWWFYLGGAQGAEENAFHDLDWCQLDLPHDWK